MLSPSEHTQVVLSLCALYLQVLKGETIFDDSFAEKFGKLRAITEETTVILLDS